MWCVTIEIPTETHKSIPVRRKKKCRKTKVKVDGRREGGPEENWCHKLEDKCTQKRRLEDDREGGQGPTRTVEPCISSSMWRVWVRRGGCIGTCW